jgi:hypothetical protein
MSVSKIVAAAASGVGGAGLDVDEVFSTFLYDGNGGTQSITNNIDLSGEGGLVWIKSRSSADNNWLFNTERGAGKALYSNSNQAENTFATSLSAFNSNGFSLGSIGETNGSGKDIVSWSFRKAPKFFDVVTYTGNGVAGRTISHNLDNLVGMLMIKCTSHDSDWSVQHRMLLPSKYLALNENTSAQTDTARFHSTAAGTSTFSVGSGNAVNGSGRTYVAYLFSHNNNGNPGEFGPDSDQDVIKCGSFTTGGSGAAIVNVGFEPQWIMIKRTDGTGNWQTANTVQGWDLTGANPLFWNLSNAESDVWGGGLFPTSTGFEVTDVLGNNYNFIYMAIRRGPLAAPDDATKVFAMDDSSTTDIGGYTLNSNFPVDFYFFKSKDGGDSISIPRLTVGDLRFNSSFAEEDRSSLMNFDSNTGVTRTSFQGGIDSVDYAFRRASGFFDVVAYTGTGTAGLTVNHNLGVAPEMTWVKRRDSAANWRVNVAAIGTDGQNSPSLRLNMSNAAEDDNGSYFGNNNSGGYAAPTSSVLTFGGHGDVNASGGSYIALLFATVAGVSKVGSYTGNDGSTNVDCGFSNGARFILIKKTNGSGDWFIFDSTRGIVAGNDPSLKLNTTEAEDDLGARDIIDPLSSGFTVNANRGGVNDNGDTFIFYAIA